MKQSKINKFFSPGKITPSCKPLFPRSNHSNSSGSSGEMFYNVNFLNADPMLIYEKIREKEKHQARNSGVDVRPTSVESDLSSQSSSQQLFHNSQLFEGSQAMLGSSSHSDDSATWYQQWINKPQNMFRNQSDVKPFMQNRNSGKQASIHSQEYKQYLDAARKKSKEKEDRDMLQNFLTLAKECCEEAKAAATSVSGKIDHHLSESSVTNSLTNEKLTQMVKHLKGLEKLLKAKHEYTDKIAELEKRLEAQNKENDELRRELDEVRNESDNAMVEKLTETFDKGQQLCSNKIEELFVNTSEIKEYLKKPKLATTDMWSQYSPRLALFPLQIAKSDQSIDLVDATVNVSPDADDIIYTNGNNIIPFVQPNLLNTSQYSFTRNKITSEASTSTNGMVENPANSSFTTISTLCPFLNTSQLAQNEDSCHEEQVNTVALQSLENLYTFVDIQSPSTSRPYTRSSAIRVETQSKPYASYPLTKEADNSERNAIAAQAGNKAKSFAKAVKKRRAKNKFGYRKKKQKKNIEKEEVETIVRPMEGDRHYIDSVGVRQEGIQEPSFTVVRKATPRSWFLDSDEELTNVRYLSTAYETYDSIATNDQGYESPIISMVKQETSGQPCFFAKEMLPEQGDRRPAGYTVSSGFGDLFG